MKSEYTARTRTRNGEVYVVCKWGLNVGFFYFIILMIVMFFIIDSTVPEGTLRSDLKGLSAGILVLVNNLIAGKRK